MPKRIQSLLENLFATGEPSGQTLQFHWRLVQRHGRPLLLLPENSMDLRVGLELYSAQRRRAKIWRALLPKILRSPATIFYRRVTLRVDIQSEFVRFLAAQSGVPVAQLRAPSIKFGGAGEKKSRLALLICDQTNRPVKVIKAGLNPAGCEATEREADLLAQLPSDVIGCIRMSGRMATENFSAFATPFFPGASPENDAGMEIVFHSWLSQAEPMPVDEFESWRKLAKKIPADGAEKFLALKNELADKKIRSTLFHGDFTSWNLRAVNAMNLQAYDWEGGFLCGIPGWDWFHFFVQTSILVKRYSAERVAAELDELVQSPRFQKYARAAGIEKIVEPLLLGYLLHQKYVIAPMEGGKVLDQLLDLLWTQWRLKKNVPLFAPEFSHAPASAAAQLKNAITSLVNLFWRPGLSHEAHPSLASQLQTHWFAVFLSCAWILGIVNLPLWMNPHMLYTPFYLVPCVFMALRTNRRLAGLVTLVAAIVPPLLFFYVRPDFVPFRVIVWNIVMRVVVFELIVLLLDRIRKQSVLRSPQNISPVQNPIEAIAGNWAVILFAFLFFALVVALDIFTDVNLIFLALYIVPCTILTLAMNWRWGTMLAFIAAVVGPLLQRPDPAYQPWIVEGWNTAMRFMIFEIVVLLVERVRREHILFSGKKHG